MPPIRILSAPGIKRDGTLLEGDAHVDGRHVRWHRKMPYKMLGHKQLQNGFHGPFRGMDLISRAGFTTVHVGSANRLERVQINNSNGVSTGVVDRTPAGFVTSNNNMWQIDNMYNSVAVAPLVLAHAAPNLMDISNNVAEPINYGDAFAVAALAAIAGSDVDGGHVVLGVYDVRFGSDGFVGWCVPGDPTNVGGAGSGAAYVVGSKFVYGLPLRAGPGNAPAGILWSLDSIVRMMFVGGAPIFSFDVISSQSSVLSQQSFIEYDGAFYWAGIGRFLTYNGALREVPNEMNLEWFNTNLNWSQRQKVFARKVPAWGEIWWCFPYGSATECTHAVILNIREGCWYDTELPTNMRSAAAFDAQVFPYPLMMDGSDSLWQHETGFDEVTIAGQTNAIRSYYETNEISFVIPGPGGQPMDKSMMMSWLQPDFVQVGDMTAYVIGRANARGTEINSDIRTFGPTTQEIDFTQGNRLQRFHFESNVAGGNYIGGTILADVKPGDSRRKD